MNVVSSASGPLLLSLCVPTYNRASWLAVSLRAILSQLTPAMRDTVEVVVLDNASPDETPQVVAEAQADFPAAAVRHVRRPENIGCDGNFTDAPNQVEGEFVYLLSDDDVLLPGAVETLLGLIQKHPRLDAFALNARPFWHSPDEPTVGVLKLPADCLLPDRDQALAALGAHLTFISCIAFRRTNVAGRDYTARYQTNLAQAYMFLDALAPGNGLYAVKQPLLAQRADNNEGFDFFRVFVTNFHALMQYAQAIGYAPDTVRRILNRHLRFLCYFIAVFKSKGAIGTIRPDYTDAFRRILRAYGVHPVLLLVMAPMMLTPRCVYTALFPRLLALRRQRTSAAVTRAASTV